MKKDDFINKYKEEKPKVDLDNKKSTIDERKPKGFKGILLYLIYLPGVMITTLGVLMKVVIPNGAKEIIDIINSTEGIPDELLGEVRSVKIAMKVAPILIIIGLIIIIMTYILLKKLGGKNGKQR